MKLTASPRQSAWHDKELSERFIHELARLEKGPVKELDSSARWMEQLLVELGQLAQNMIHLESDAPHPPQLLQAQDRALKLSALATHLAGALNQAHELLTHGESGGAPEPERRGMAAAVEAATLQAEAIGMPAAEDPDTPAPVPMRRAIQSLADRGVSVAELELITGYPRHVIQAILSGN